MTDILITIFSIAALIVAITLIQFLCKRTALLLSVRNLGKTDDVTVEINSYAALFLTNVSKKPFATVKCRNKIYLVRIFNGIGSFKSVHIASERYAAVFTKTGGDGMRQVKGRSGRFRRVSEPIRVYGAVTKIIPPLEPSFIPEKKKLPEGYENFYFEEKPVEAEIIPTLIFCPAPAELTFVTPERTSIKIAFTGDTVIGHRIFTKETFSSFIDRDSRGFFDR